MALLASVAWPNGGGVTGGHTNGNGTCTGATQVLFAQNSGRKWLFIYNNGNADIFFEWIIAATSSGIKIPAGGSYEMVGPFVCGDAVNLIGTAAQTFIAKEG